MKDKRGRKKSKYGKVISFYLSNEEIALLNKLTYPNRNKSKFIGRLIKQHFNNERTRILEEQEDPIKLIINNEKGGDE